MRVLLLNQTFYPDVASTAQHLGDLAVGLVRRGHEVSVVTSDRAYDQPATRFPRFETWKGIPIHRVFGTGFGKTSRWRRAVDFASFTGSCALKLLTLPKHDAVVALTSPPLIAFLAALYCRVRGAKLYYWVMDLNPDAAVAAGWIAPDSLAARFLEVLSRFAFRSSHQVIVLDRFMRDRVITKGVPPDRILTIAPWSHDEFVRWDPEGRQKFRAKHGLEGRFVVMYSGNHSPCHPLKTLLEAARTLADDPSLAFCFVGGGSEHSAVRRYAAEHKLKNVHVLPYAPLEELSGSLSAADLHTVVMGNPFVGMIHPCKIYNALAVGAPILYLGPTKSHLGDIFRTINDPDHLLQVEHGDVDRMIQQLKHAATLGTRGDQSKYASAVESFGPGRLLEVMLDAISDSNSQARQSSVQRSRNIPATPSTEGSKM